MKEIPDELWTVALKGAEQDFIEKILGALPKRLAQVYQQQIDSLGPQPIRKIEAARHEIMGMVKEMMDQGNVDYHLYQEEVLE
jgi:flagellar motor switch protein FliG